MAKTWEETVMSDDKLMGKAMNALTPIANRIELGIVHTTVKAQAEATWHSRDAEVSEAKKAGIKEVVEWGNEWCPHRDNDFPCPEYVPDELRLHKRDCPDCWQAKLKEWGIK